MKRFAEAVRVLFVKEITLEWRSRESLAAMAVFGILVLVIFRNAGNALPDTESVEPGVFLPGILWVAVAFGGILAMNRSHARDLEDRVVDAIRLAPMDPCALYFGKFLANLVLLFCLGLFLYGLSGFFYNRTILGPFPAFVLVLLSGCIGFSAVGTLLAGVAAATKMREIVLPLLLLPLTVPVFAFAVEATTRALQGEVNEVYFHAIRNLFIYDLVFLILAWLGFGFVLEE